MSAKPDVEIAIGAIVTTLCILLALGLIVCAIFMHGCQG